MRWGLATALLVCCGCSGARSDNPALTGGVFGTPSLRVPLSLVETRLRPEAVRSDLLLATGYAMQHPGALESEERRALSRGLLESLKEESWNSPPSEAELSRARERLWTELDRPRSVRLLAAFVAVPALAVDEAAFTVAKRIADAVRDDVTTQSFVEHAKAAGTDENPVQLSVMAPVSADGRVVLVTQQDGNLPRPPSDVANAYSELFEVGARSGVVAAKEGFYVFFTTEVLPALRIEGPEADQKIRAAVLEERLAPRTRTLIDELKKRAQVVRSPAVAEVLPLVWNSW